MKAVPYPPLGMTESTALVTTTSSLSDREYALQLLLESLLGSALDEARSTNLHLAKLTDEDVNP